MQPGRQRGRRTEAAVDSAKSWGGLRGIGILVLGGLWRWQVISCQAVNPRIREATGQRTEGWSTIGAGSNRRSGFPSQPDDLSRSLIPFQRDGTLVAGVAPSLDSQAPKRLGLDEQALLRLAPRWRDEAANGAVER